MTSPHYDPEDHKDKSGHTSPEFLHELEKKHRDAPDSDKASKQESEEVRNASENERKNSDDFSYRGGEGEDEHEDQVGRGYVPHKPHGKGSSLSARKWLFNKRKAALGGGAVGTIVGLLFFFTFTSGPLEFIHLAQLMERFHFSTNQDLSDDRFTKIARYIHYRSTGEVEKTRLGVLQNKIADKIETRMAKSGIETSYTDTFRFQDGYVIDPKKLEGTALKELDGKNPGEVRTYFQERYPGLDMDIRDGKLFINAESLGYFRRSALTKDMMKASGYSKKTSVVGARIMGKRYGISWHPMKKLDKKILTTAEARYKEWRKNHARAISDGEAPNLTPRSAAQDDPDDPNNQQRQNNAGGASGEAEGTLSDASDASQGTGNGDADSISKFQEKISARLNSSSGAAGVLCLAQGIGQNAGDIKHAQVVAPLIRMGAGVALAEGNQVKAGQEVDLEQLGFLKKQLTGKDSSGKKSSWNQAKSIKAMLGQSGGVEADDTLKTISKGSPFDFLSEGTTGATLSPVCTVINSPVGIVIGFLGGPVSGIANIVSGEVLGRTLIPQIARWLAGRAVDPFVAGADFGNYANYGSFLAANAQAIGFGGRQLGSDEARQLAEHQNSESQREFSSRGVAYRLFNPYDYRSAVSQAIDNRSSLNLASSAFNPLKLFSSLPQIFSKKAAAQAGSYNYGVAKIGFSKDEINNRTVENPYKNAEEVVNIILPARGQSFIDRAEKCFGVGIDPTSYDITSYQAGDPKYKDDELGSGDCTDKSQDWLKVRFYIFDTIAMDSAACYEGEEQSCADIGFSATSEESDTSSGGTVSGNAEEIAKQILSNNNIDLSASNFCRYCVEDIRNTAAGKPAYGSVRLDINLLRFLLALGNESRVDVNSISGAGSGHSATSNHYRGTAIDFGCSLDVSKADSIGKRFGITRYTGEACPGDGHWHYSTTGD